MRLVADNIACVRGGRQVFAMVSFSVAAGEALLVSGPNGAGKSSLLRTIAGLVRLAAGRLTLQQAGDANIGEQAHYLGHLDAVKPTLTVQENLHFWTEYLGCKKDIAGALDRLGLRRLADLPAGYLSAGQKRRLSIARLVAVERPIWLLDEPTSALDTSAQTSLAELMHGHLRNGGMIIAASHGPIGLDNTRTLQLGIA